MEIRCLDKEVSCFEMAITWDEIRTSFHEFYTNWTEMKVSCSELNQSILKGRSIVLDRTSKMMKNGSSYHEIAISFFKKPHGLLRKMRTSSAGLQSHSFAKAKLRVFACDVCLIIITKKVIANIKICNPVPTHLV